MQISQIRCIYCDDILNFIHWMQTQDITFVKGNFYHKEKGYCTAEEIEDMYKETFNEKIL